MAFLEALSAFVLLSAAPQQAVQTAQMSPGPTRDPAKTAVAIRTPAAVTIDGKADDAIWQTAPKLSGFTEFDPKDGGDPRFKTEFQ